MNEIYSLEVEIEALSSTLDIRLRELQALKDELSRVPIECRCQSLKPTPICYPEALRSTQG